MFYQAVKKIAKASKKATDAKIHSFAKQTRRMVWKFSFVAATLVGVSCATVYVVADATLPHLHNIYSAAKLVDGEARGEPRHGQKAVFASVLARMERNDFPATMHGVIYQPYSRNAKLLQYNAMGDEHHEDLSTDLGQVILIRTAWWYVQNEMGFFQAPKEARGAHSYCTPAACERQVGYFGRLDRIGTIGNHVFYGDADEANVRIANNLAPITSPRPMSRPTALCSEQDSLAPCTSPRPMVRPQSSLLDEQSGKEIDAVIASIATE